MALLGRGYDGWSGLARVGLADLRYDASALIHDFEPELIEGLLIHDLEPSFVCFGDGMAQVAEVDANRIARDFLMDVDVEEIPWHSSGTPAIGRGSTLSQGKRVATWTKRRPNLSMLFVHANGLLRRAADIGAHRLLCVELTSRREIATTAHDPKQTSRDGHIRPSEQTKRSSDAACAPSVFFGAEARSNRRRGSW